MSDINLATIQVVSEINSIPNADNIVVVSLKGLGWKCVVKKNDFQIGDKGVYIKIDTVSTDKPEFEFLRNRNFKIRTIRLKKTLSQGLLLPMSFLPQGDYQEGQDVTEISGVKKFEKEVPVNMRGLVRGNFPSCLMKTDEINIKSIPFIIDEMKGKEIYITIKCDGTSLTAANIDGDIHVCSRNLSLKETDENIYWKAYRKYNIAKVFEKHNNIAIQAEICSPGLQKNRLGLKDVEIFVFNIYDIKEGRYWNYAELISFCSDNNLPTVPLLKIEKSFNETLESLIEMAKIKYGSGQNAEGIVLRTTTETYSKGIDEAYGMSGRLSCKVLNDIYLEKDED